MAFAKFYWEETSRAAHVGDTAKLKRLYSTECDVCQEYVHLVEKDLSKGLRTDIDATTVKGTAVTADADGKSDQAVTLRATDAAYELVDETGESEEKSERLDYKVIIYVDWTSGGWTVVDSFMIT